MELQTTCSCGASLTVSDEFSHYATQEHERFLKAHLQCRVKNPEISDHNALESEKANQHLKNCVNAEPQDAEYPFVKAPGVWVQDSKDALGF